MNKRFFVVLWNIFNHPVILFFLFLGLTIFSYKDLLQLYYLNDDFLQYAQVLVNGIGNNLVDRLNVTDMVLGRARPIGSLMNNLFYSFFPFSSVPFAIFSYIIHSLNGVFAYSIIKKICRNSIVAIIAAVFFITGSIAVQSFVWLGASTQVLGSMCFLLLSILLYIQYLDTRIKWIVYVSWMCLYISILFKDTSVFALPFLPMIALWYPNTTKKSVRSFFQGQWLWLAAVFVFGVYRWNFLYGYLSQGFVLESLIKSNSIYLFNILFYPFIALAQFFIPFRFMYRLASVFGEYLYPFTMTNAYASVRQTLTVTVFSDMLGMIISAFILVSIVLIYLKEKKFRATLVFASTYYVLSLIPIAIYLERRSTFYIESRYLYASMFPIGIFIGILTSYALVFFQKKKPLIRIAGISSIMLLMLFFFVKQVFIIRREVFDSVLQGLETKRVWLETQKTSSIPDNPIFFLDGDRFYYYPHIKAPVQLGPGFFFLLQYYRSHHLSKAFFNKNNSFWQIYFQGYTVVDGKGFGYFWNKEDLKQLFRDNPHLTKDQLVGLFFDSHTQTLTDMTNELKVTLKENDRQL